MLGLDNETVIVVGVSTQKLLKNQSTELRDACLDSVLNNRNLSDNLKETLSRGLKASVMNYHNLISENQTYTNSIEYDFPEILPVDGEYVLWRNTKSFVYPYSDLLKLFWDKSGKNWLTYNRVYWTDRIYPFYYLKASYMPEFMGWNSTTKELSSYPPEINALGSVSKVTWMDLPTTVVLKEWGCEVYLTIHFTGGTTQEYTYIPININGWMDRNKSLVVFEYGTDEAYYLPLDQVDVPDIVDEIVAGNTAITNKYIPTVSIRNTKVNLIDHEENENFKDVYRALKLLGIKLETVTDAIMSTEQGNDPEIIDDAFVGFGVSPATEQQATKDYLFEFAGYLTTYVNNFRTKATWEHFLANYNSPEQTFLLKDQYNIINLKGGEDNNYAHSVRYLYAEKKVIAGVIGEVGTVTTEIVTRPFIEFTLLVKADDSSFYVRKQINTGSYVEIEIRGLIWVGETYPGVVAKYYLNEYQDSSKNHIYFPIIIGLFKSIGIFDQSRILSDSLILTVYAKDEVEIPWYLTEDFLNLVQITMIVISLFSMNPQGMSVYEFLKQLAVDTIKQIIIAKLMKLAIKEIADLLGYDAVEILIILAAIYSAYEYGFKNTEWAENLLKTTMLAQNALNNVVTDDYNESVATYEATMKEYEKAFDELKELQKNIAPDMSYILSRRYVFQFNPNETPTEFFNRLTHIGNVGVLGLDAPSTYVERMLRLPKNSDFGTF
jgi:hypothetical protein